MAPDSSRTNPTGTAPVPTWAADAARYLDPATLARVLGQTRAWSQLGSDEARRLVSGALVIFAGFTLRPDGSIDPCGGKRGDLAPAAARARLAVASAKLAAAAATLEAVERVDSGVLAVGTGITAASLREQARTFDDLAATFAPEAAGAFRVRLFRALGHVAERTTGRAHHDAVAAIAGAFLDLDVSADAVRKARRRPDKAAA